MLFKQHYQPLVNYCFTLVKDRSDAEDIVQQTFVHLWQKKETLDIHSSLQAYLYKAVYNAGLNKIKQNTVRLNYVQDAKYTMSIEVNEPQEHDELKQRISAAIDRLPEQCGKIFRMSRFDEMKYQEIADALNISVKTVENQMGKALRLLREALKEHLVVILLLLNLTIE